MRPNPAHVGAKTVGPRRRKGRWPTPTGRSNPPSSPPFMRWRAPPPRAPRGAAGAALRHAPCLASARAAPDRSEEHTSELQSRGHLVCRLLLEKKKKKKRNTPRRTQKNKRQKRA